MTHSKPDNCYIQSAVIPYRRHEDGIRFLLVTSRKRKRWVLPKGICEPGMSAAASAAKEALEEAGVKGPVASGSVGSYQYRKWNGTCTVEVFTMAVETVLDQWDEQFRDRQWLTPEDAASRVAEPELRRLLLATAGRLRRR